MTARSSYRSPAALFPAALAAVLLSALATTAPASACAFHGFYGGGFDPFAFGGHMEPTEAELAAAARFAPQPSREEALARQRADLLARTAIKVDNPLPAPAGAPSQPEAVATN